jgi:hypothetical protein
LRICKRFGGSDLHLVRIDGHPVGVFPGREGRRIDGGRLRAEVVFVFIRDADAVLTLAGIAQRNDGQYRVFHLTNSTEWVQALNLDFRVAGPGRFVRIAAGP